MSASEPSRADVWSINLDPTLGREQSGRRAALVVSVDKFNHGPADLIVVLPITSKNKKQPIHVSIKPPDGGLSTLSFVKCEDIRSVSKQPQAVLWDRLGADRDRGREAYPNPSKLMNQILGKKAWGRTAPEYVHKNDGRSGGSPKQP